MKEQLFLILAIISGIAAAATSFFYIESAEPSSQQVQGTNRVQVLFTLKDLEPGMKINAQRDLRVDTIDPVTQPGLGRGAIRAGDRSFANGQRVSVQVPAGAPLLYAYLLDSDAAADEVLELRAGFSALSVEVTPESLAGGFIKVGSEVDVYATFRKSTGDGGAGIEAFWASPDGELEAFSPDQIMAQALQDALSSPRRAGAEAYEATVVAEAIRVMAIGGSTRSTSVTLEVTREQAQTLLASTAGGDQLSLAVTPVEETKDKE